MVERAVEMMTAPGMVFPSGLRFHVVSGTVRVNRQTDVLA